MANDGGSGERLKGQKKRTNPHDVAKRMAEKYKCDLDFFGVGKERSNDFLYLAMSPYLGMCMILALVGTLTCHTEGVLPLVF